MIKEYFQRTGWKRFVIMVLGNVICGMGIGLFKLAGLGNDPFSGVNMAVSDRIGMSYPIFQILINLVYLTVELLWGRKYIGIGTVVNALFLGYFTAFFHWIFSSVYVPAALAAQVVVLMIGMIVASLGLSLYQTSDVGIAPYDSLALILNERVKKLPYFWCRMIFDGSCALICFLCGGIIGLGTLVTAFGFGPVIHFFNVHFSEKLLAKEAGHGSTDSH